MKLIVTAKPAPLEVHKEKTYYHGIRLGTLEQAQKIKEEGLKILPQNLKPKWENGFTPQDEVKVE